jgi:hypothetical protein
MWNDKEEAKDRKEEKKKFFGYNMDQRISAIWATDGFGEKNSCVGSGGAMDTSGCHQTVLLRKGSD